MTVSSACLPSLFWTVAVRMPSRSAALAVRMTRLTSVPSTGSTLAGSFPSAPASSDVPRQAAKGRRATISTTMTQRLRCSKPLFTVRFLLEVQLPGSGVDACEAEAHVKGGQNEEADQRRGDESAKHDDRERVQELVAGDRAENDKGQEGKSRCQGGDEDGPKLLLRPALNELGTERLSLVPLEVLEVLDEQDAVLRDDPQHPDEADQRAERECAAVGQRAERAAGEGQRQDRKRQQCQAEAAKGRLQDEQDPDGCEDSEGHQPAPRGTSFLIEHLRVVLKRELSLLETPLHVAHNGAPTAAADVGCHIDIARDGLMPDDGGVRPDLYVCDVPQRHLPSVRRVDGKLANTGQAGAGLWSPPHHDVEDLLLLEEASDLDPCHQRGRGATNLARLDPVPLGRGEIDLHLQSRLLGGRLYARVADSLSVREDLAYLPRLRSEHLQVLAVHAHDQVFVCPRQHLFDSLLREGQYVESETGIAFDRLPNRGDRRVVIGPRLDADPELRGIDVDRLIRCHGAPHMRADVAHPRNRLELTADLIRDPGHLRKRGTGRAARLNQELRLLEGGRERGSEEGQGREAGHDDGADGDVRPSGRAKTSQQECRISLLQPSCAW